MKSLIKFFIDYWFWCALVMSLFWGLRGVFLFAKSRNYWWKSYQFIFNFVGSFAGWCCFYALLIRVQYNIPDFRGFTWGDFILFIISLLALTGHLPQSIYGLVEGFAEISKKATEKLVK